ncbi:MAG: translocation/assembly module TamB, partial [Treponema sp.]|nr:translocation/assembly module TamB [Treponema sp.]
IYDDRITVDGRWNIGTSIGRLAGIPFSLNTVMRVSGSCRTDLKEGEAVLSIPSIGGDVFSSSPVTFSLVLDDNFIRMGKMPDNLPFDVSFEYRLDDGMIDTRFECSGFRLSEFLTFSEGLEGARLFQDIDGSGSASFVRRQDGSIGYAMNMAGTAQNASPHVRMEEISFTVNIAGNEKDLLVNALHLSVPVTGEDKSSFFFGDIMFAGNVGLDPFKPEGVLSLADFSLSGKSGVSADIAIRTQDNAASEISASSKALSIGPVNLDSFAALLNLSENDFGFTVSALRPPNAEAEDRQAGALSLEGRINTSQRIMEANILADSLTAGELIAMTLPFIKDTDIPMPLGGMLNSTVISARVFFVTDFVHLSYDAPDFYFASRAGKGFSGLVSISGTDYRFEINKGTFRWGEDTLSLSGNAEFYNRQDISFVINTNYRNLQFVIEGAIADGQSVKIRGPYGLDVSLAASKGRYTGSMRADGFPIPFLGQPAYCSFTAHLRYDNRTSWQMNLEQLEVTDIAGPAGLAQVRFSGSVDQKGANFPLLFYRDAVGPLNGTADISWAPDFSGYTGTVVMSGGEERYRIESALSEHRISLGLSGSSMRIDRAFSRIKAQATGNINLSWDSLESFNADLNLSSITGAVFDRGFGAAARAVLDNDTLTVSRLNFSYAGIEGSIPGFTIDGKKGYAETRADIAGLAGGRPVEGALLLTAGFKPIRSWKEINEIINTINGTVSVERLRYGIDGQVQTFNIDFSHANGAFSITGGPRNMIRFQMDKDGNFYGGLSSPFPVRGTVIGNIKHKTIDAYCNDVYVDLGELFKLLPESESFYLTGGYVNVSAEIKGPITDPEFFGSARATSLRIMVPDFVPYELRPIPFTIAIEGNELRFGPVSTSVGSGAGAVTGLFYIDRWIPNIFSIDVAIPQRTPVPYSFDITGFIAHGDAYGNLNISMENLMFDISGDLVANNSEMGINHVELTGSGEGSVFSQDSIPFVVNLTVNTGPVVEFLYPSSRFPILRATPDMGTKLYITADSMTQQFSLVSDVRIRSGEIFYFERSFYIRSGTLTLRENELRFDPRLTARAEARDRNDEGPVTISMLVENAPLLSFNARFESNPPLSQMDILGLLGQSIAGAQFSEDTDSVQRAFLSSTSDLLAQFVLVRQMERQIRSFMRLDMFSVRTQVFQNALFMATGLMPPSVDRIGGVGNYFDNTTVFGGKYIGQDMFVQGMLSMRYDANKASFGGLTFAPDIGLELQNPLFSIRWDFVPTHPENWYANDNSITLTWNRTF